MANLRVVGVVLCILVYVYAQNEKTQYSGLQTDHKVEPNLLSNFLRQQTDFCYCVNVPFEASSFETWSVHSDGKDLLAYFEPNCLEKKWKAMYLVRVNSRDRINWYDYQRMDRAEQQKRYTIHSFGPNPDSEIFKTSCIKNPNVAVMAIEMLETESELTKPITCANENKGTSSTNTDKTQFFAKPHFQDFVFDKKVAKDCTNIMTKNIKDQVTSDMRSIRTNECVILYSGPDCFGRSTTIHSPGTTNLKRQWESTLTGLSTLKSLYKLFPDWVWSTKSFKSCNIYNANERLNVDITEFHINSNVSSKPKILETYNHVCTCQNIPKHVRNLERWSIDNHDTAMIAYFEQDCTSHTFAPLWIPAGQSSYSTALGAFVKFNKRSNDIRKILSFGPDQDSCYFKTTCVKLYSTIIKFEITEQNYTEQTDEMVAPKNIFTNDGPMPSTQTFTASETVKESFSVNIGTSLNQMQNVKLQNSFEIENKTKTNESELNSGGVSIQANISASLSGPLKKLGVKVGGSISGGARFEHSNSAFSSHEAIVKEGLIKAYQNGSSVNSSRRLETIVEKEKSVTVSQVLTLPPCSEHAVYAYVKRVKNRNIEYRALVKINGYFGTRKMTAIEVRKFMDDQMQYSGDFDKNTVLAYTTNGEIHADYGTTTLFSTKVRPIPECLERYNLSSGSTWWKVSLVVFLLIILCSVAGFLLYKFRCGFQTQQ